MFLEFFQPASLREALELRERFGENAVFHAGGTALNAKNRSVAATVAIGLGKLSMDGVEVTKDGVCLGAAITIQDLIDLPGIPSPLRVAAGYMVSRNVRNIATLGGNVASVQSCPPMVPVLFALEAQLEVATLGATRLVPVEEWVGGRREGLITAIKLRGDGLGRRVAQRRFCRTANDTATVSVAVSARLEGGRLLAPIIAVGGVSAYVVRLGAVEREIDGKPLGDSGAVELLVAGAVSPQADIRGSVEYKRHIAGVFVYDCLAELGGQS